MRVSEVEDENAIIIEGIRQEYEERIDEMKCETEKYRKEV